jgi:AmmeMemoRadiSam system protein A
MPVDEPTKRLLVNIARYSLVEYLVNCQHYEPPLEELPARLQEPGASFITLYLSGELRGCVGSVEPRYPLAVDVARNAVVAATQDPRFVPVSPAELDRIRLSVTVLNPLQPLAYAGEQDLVHKLRPGVDGVLLTWQMHRSLLLPQVWKHIEEPHEFLRALAYKGGIPARELTANPPTVNVYTFTAESCAEDE